MTRKAGILCPPEVVQWTFRVGLLVLLTAAAGPLFPAQQERAILPSQHVNIEVSSPGEVIDVPAGGDFQAALERAAPGDIIELQAGAVFRGPFILPRKPIRPEPEARWITIRSSTSEAGGLPQGVRVSPADAPAMAKLETGSGSVVVTAPGAHHYRFSGIEFRPTANPPAATGDTPVNALVWLGAEGTSADLIPHHIIIERCYLHGDAEAGTRRGIVLNSSATAVVDSWLADFKMIGDDSQAIIGWDGPGPYRIQNNYLEAAGENIMFGGADPRTKGLVPADIEIRGNHFARPLAWKAGESGYAGTTWSVKNLFELKNARRVLVDGNLFEYNWPESQNGYAILLTVRNQDGTAPWSVVEDVTFSNNIVRHVGSGINILGHDDNHPSQRTQRIVISNNLFEDLGGAWGSGDLIQLLDGTVAVVFEHNTAINSGLIIKSEGRPHSGFLFRGNIVLHNHDGIIGRDVAAGKPTLQRYFAGAVVQGNLIAGGAKEDYPAGNAFPKSLEAIGFVDPLAGDFRLQTGSPFLAEGRRAGVDFVALCDALSVTEAPVFCAAGELPLTTLTP